MKVSLTMFDLMFGQRRLTEIVGFLSTVVKCKSAAKGLAGGAPGAKQAHSTITPSAWFQPTYALFHVSAGVHALLLSSASLQQLNVDSCHMLSASCCPEHFAMTGHDLSCSNSNSSGSSRRPSTLIRIAMRAAAAVDDRAAEAAAADASAVQAKVAAAVGRVLGVADDDDYGSGELIGTEVAAAFEVALEGQLDRGIGSTSSSQLDVAGVVDGQSQGQGHSTAAASSVGYLELSALQKALDQPRGFHGSAVWNGAGFTWLVLSAAGSVLKFLISHELLLESCCCGAVWNGVAFWIWLVLELAAGSL
jgi:hypothetical protein